MLKPVINIFGVTHYNAAHGCYKLEDAQRRYYWLDGDTCIKAVQQCQEAESSWTQEECLEFVLDRFDEDMDGVEEDEGDMPYCVYSLNTELFGYPVTDEEADTIEAAINDRLEEYEVSASVRVSDGGTIGETLPPSVNEHVAWVFHHLQEILG